MSSFDATAALAAQRAYGKPTKARTQKKTNALGITNEELVKKYSPLVYRIAKRVRRRTGYAVELDDLVCEGTIGLLQAAERFDPGFEKDFEHLASVRVRGAMLDALRRLDPLSQRRRREARRQDKVRQKLRAALEREPGADEMAEALGIDLETYHTLHNELSAQQPLSLDDMATEVRAEQVLPEQLVARKERLGILKEAIADLPERPKLVLSLIYFNELSQKDVAAVLSVTEARISQIHKEALAKLKKKVHSQSKPGEDGW